MNTLILIVMFEAVVCLIFEQFYLNTVIPRTNTGISQVKKYQVYSVLD